MNYLLESYKQRKVLGAVFVCLIMCLGLSLVDNGRAHAAVLLGGIPYDIQTGSPNYAGEGLAPFDTTNDPGQSGGCWENGQRFTQSEWSWIFNENGPPPNSADDAVSPGTAFSVNVGSQLNLGVAALTFLCNGSITPDNTFSAGDNSFTGSNNPQDGTPNTGVGGFFGTFFTPINGWQPGSGYLTEETKFQFDQPAVTSCVNVNTGGPCAGGSAGSFNFGGTDPMTIEYQNGTRYWYPPLSQSLSFNYTPPAAPGSYYVGITLPIHEANHWDIPGGADGQPGPDIYQCVDKPYNFLNGGQYGNIESNCTQASVTYYVYVNVVSPTISGTVYAYNGITEQPIANANIYTCNGWTTTNAAGQFSFSLAAGTGFCIRLVDSGTSTTTITAAQSNGDTVEISPNSPGPPPQPPPSCGGNSQSYEGQVAALTSSPGACNYSLGNNSGYNIGVTVHASLSCSVSANPPVIASGQSTTIITGVNIVNQGMWWFLTGALPASASYELTGPAIIGPYGMSAAVVPPFAYGYSAVTPAINQAGQYNISSTVTSASADLASTSCVSNASSGGGVTVQYEPYLRVFGGDVFAGTDSADIASCFDGGANAAIYSFNDNTVGTGNIGTGAGTSVAALDTGGTPAQLGFSSGQGNILGLFDPLTFSNDPNGIQPYYGGGFNTAVQNCAGQADYFNQAKSLPNAVPCPADISTASLASVATIIGNTAQFGPGQSYICYSGGNVEISSNITYNIAGANANNLPLFEIVTDAANINIDNNASALGNAVNKLFGTYIAENGNICDNWHSVGGCIVDEPSSSTPNNTIAPLNQLTIDGTFIANQLDLYRSYGTVGSDTVTNTPHDSYDAEEFDYSPVNWLAPGSGQASVESVTSLPPVY